MDSDKNHIHITHITYYKAQGKLKYEKSCKIDLFNYTPKRCEGTEINTVRKRIPAINHTFAEKICTHAMSILALTKLKCMSVRDLTWTKNKQIIEADLYQSEDNFVAPKQIEVVTPKI